MHVPGGAHADLTHPPNPPVLEDKLRFCIELDLPHREGKDKMAAMTSMTLRPRTALVSARPSSLARRAAPRVVTVKALGDTQLVISGKTASLVWGLCYKSAFSALLLQAQCHIDQLISVLLLTALRTARPECEQFRLCSSVCVLCWRS